MKINRTVLTAASFIVLCAVAQLAFADQAMNRPVQTVRGRVYYDLNADGVQGQEEPPATGVSVGTAWDTVQTDENGTYSLSSDEEILSVYVNIPAGTWPVGKWWHPVGTNTEAAFDFGLKKEPQLFPFVFAQITDPHLSFPEVLKSIPQECATLPVPPKFYFVTGDLLTGSPKVDDPVMLDYYDQLEKIIADAPAPMFVISGNHDGLRGPMDHPNFGHRLWEQMIGPRNWMFSYADLTFAAIGWPDRLPGNKWASWEPMDEWMREQDRAVPENRRKIYMAHGPRVPPGIRPHLWIHGHTHEEGTAPWADWVLAAGAAQNLKWDRSEPQPYIHDERPAGYRLFVVHKDRIEHFYKATGHPRTIMVLAPRRDRKISNSEAVVIEGQVFDPNQTIEKLSVHLGDVPLAVSMERKTLWVDFTATGDISKLTEGYHDLSIRATWPDEAAELKEPYFVQSGNLPDFEAQTPATLTGNCLYWKISPFKILVNGVLVGEVNSGKFSFEIPASVLKQINVITWPEGAKERVRMFDCAIDYQGKTFSPQRRSGGLAWTGDNPKQIIDLNYPGPVVNWAILPASN